MVFITLPFIHGLTSISNIKKMLFPEAAILSLKVNYPHLTANAV